MSLRCCFNVIAMLRNVIPMLRNVIPMLRNVIPMLRNVIPSLSRNAPPSSLASASAQIIAVPRQARNDNKGMLDRVTANLEAGDGQP
jgi:hypothetical protein